MERQVQDLGQAAHKECFGQAGHTDHEHVTLHGEGDKQILNHFLLPDDPLTQFRGEQTVAGGNGPEQINIRFADRRGKGESSMRRPSYPKRG